MRLEERGFYSPSFRIPWEQLSSSLSITLNFLLGFRVSPSRFTDLWIREGSRTGFVTSLLLSTAVFEIIKPLSLGQPPPPIYPSSPLLSPLPGQVYFQIASGEKRGGGGKQKRRNREYLHSPTPFPLPIISLLWTRDEKLERLKKKEASKQASKQACRARSYPLTYPEQSRLTLHSQKLHGWTKTDLSCILAGLGSSPQFCLPFDSIFANGIVNPLVPSCCYVGYEMIRGMILAFSRHEIKLCPATCIEIHSIIRRQRICNEITSGSDMRNLTSLSTFRAVNLNSKLSDERANQLWNREDDRDRIDRVLLSGDK